MLQYFHSLEDTFCGIGSLSKSMFSYLRKWRQNEWFSEEGETEFCSSWDLSHRYPLPVTTLGAQSGNCPSRQRKWEIFGYCPRREVLHKYFLLLQWWMGIKRVLAKLARKPANAALLCTRLNLPSLQMLIVPELVQNSAISDTFCSKCKLGVTE